MENFNSNKGNEEFVQVSEIPEKQEWVPNQIVVKLNPTISSEEVNQLKDQLDVKVVETANNLGLQVWNINENLSVEETIKSLSKDQRFEFVEPNYIYSTQPIVPNDSLINEEWVPNQLVVKLNPTISSDEVKQLQEQLGANVIETINTLGIQLWNINENLSVEGTIKSLSEDPRFEFIEPNYIYSTQQTFPNDSSFSREWGLHNTGQTGGTVDADIDAPEAWDFETGSSNIVVGVIDTGIDYTHPDLNDNMWTNPGEIAGDGIDNDGNGYVDDIYGWDFVNNDNDPFDDESHGTHVAGTIAAEGNNSIGVAGVSWDASLMALKFLDANGNGSSFHAAQAIQYATDNGADLTNNSWGGGFFSNAVFTAIQNAQAADVLFVAAAGNSSSNNDVNPAYPASYNLDNIISVASTTHNDQLSSFSNYGATSVDLGAPGSSIFSTIPGGGYGYKSGTSMASPHVAGAASLILSQNPSLTSAQVKDIILSTADPISALSGITLTGARLNIGNALNPNQPSGGEISGTKWNDLDGDGVRDSGETGLQGWTIYLDQNQNSQLDSGETSTTTDANGNYSFTNLGAGTYYVAEVLQSGWEQTFPGNNEVLTFDDISSGNGLVPIPNNYGGLSWSNDFYYLNGVIYSPSGYDNGRVSGDYVAYNASSQPVEVSSNNLFDFNSAYLTAAWNNNLNIRVEGLLNGIQKYDQSVTVNPNAPTLLNFNFEEVDRLRFTSSGGTDADPNDSGSGQHFVLDNFSFNASGTHTVNLAAGVTVSDINFGNRLKQPLPNNFIGETGAIGNLTHQAQTISLKRTYKNPVVFAQPLSFNGTAPTTVRLSNITANSFTIQAQEANNEDGIHGAENLAYMVLEAGEWQLNNGTILEVGTTDSNQLVAQGWNSVSFDADFDNKPVVMSQIQTKNGGDFVNTRQRNIGTGGFQVGMEEEEANKNSGHANEKIGYLAMSGGSGTWDGLNYDAGYTGHRVTDGWTSQSLSGFTQAPLVMASLASYNGSDPAGIRRRNTTNNQVQFKVQEDTSADAETLHAAENISYFAISGQGLLTASALPSQMGETGAIGNLTHQAQTISLKRTYKNPVVFAQPLSFNGTAPTTVRLSNITGNSFTIQAQEANNEDGIHGAENLAYMVLEAGEWQLNNGTILEVGTTDSNQLVAQGWNSVSFDADFDNKPVVMSQIQTKNGGDFVNTRQRNIGTGGFQVGMEEEEANKNSGHANEKIGYLAMSGGSGTWNGLNYDAGYTGHRVTDDWTNQSLSGFTQAPLVMASLASYNGGDPAGIRRRNTTNNQVQFKVQEDTSADAETLHAAENISYFAISGKGILEAVDIGGDLNTSSATTSPASFEDSPVLAGVQTLNATSAADTFILGDATEAYYDNMGIQDYGLILYFESSEDVIQLHGSASDYQLGAAPSEVPQGTGIFLGDDELVGVVNGVSDLTLDADYFSFV